tara:strand:+ start:847 stop:1545 length:699 start_codon:yes stop_codon:yes gene_type:complete
MKTKQALLLKDMPDAEKPRERLLGQGVHVLSNTELLAILIQTGAGKLSALDLAGQVLAVDKSQGVKHLASCTQEQLMAIHGIGPSKACQILAAIELGKRVYSGDFSKKSRIKSPEDIVDVFMPLMRHLKKEEFRVCYLNTKNEVTGHELISVGSLNASIVHPREVFSQAVKRSAAAIILIHNHPSGNPEPSREDVDITKRLSESGLLLGIKVLDHVIIGGGKWYSLKAHGDM